MMNTMRQHSLFPIVAIALFATVIYAKATTNQVTDIDDMVTSTTENAEITTASTTAGWYSSTTAEWYSSTTIQSVDHSLGLASAGDKSSDVSSDSHDNVHENMMPVAKMFKEKCKKRTGDDKAYEHIVAAALHLQNCIMNMIDHSALQREVYDVQQTGQLGTVLSKYCGMRNNFIQCVENFTHVFDPCLEAKEIDGQKTTMKMFTNLLDFVCYKDGDNIASIFAEKGLNCLEEQKPALIQCLKKSSQIETKELPKLPTLVVGVEECNKLDKVQECVVKALENCEESTPANIVESMFKSAKNGTICDNLTEAIDENKIATTNAI